MRKMLLTVWIGVSAVIAAPALAESIITKSTAPDINVGDRFADDAELDVPEGSAISVLRTPDNTTHTIVGPYQGTLTDYSKTDCSVWQVVTGVCENRDVDEGAVRGLRERD